MKCPKCDKEPVYLFSGQRSREHEEDYPEPSSIYMCVTCNMLAVDSRSGYVSWWVPAYKEAIA